MKQKKQQNGGGKPSTINNSGNEPSTKLKSTPNGSPSRPIAMKVPKLKVVLDMDECLIHSIFNEGTQPGRMPFARPNAPPPSPPPQHIVPQKLESFPLVMLDKASCVVNKRPRIDWFLEQVALRFDSYVMTAGTRDYAEPLLDKLDPKRLLKARFYRDSCVFHDGHYFKDLTLVDQDPRRIVLVDNNPASVVLCPANGIPVISFYDDPHDRALEGALDVLISLENETDVRRMLRQMYNLETKLAPMVRHFQRRA
jgi:CTD small phosphatase-like protein 2